MRCCLSRSSLPWHYGVWRVCYTYGLWGNVYLLTTGSRCPLWLNLLSYMGGVYQIIFLLSFFWGKESEFRIHQHTWASQKYTPNQNIVVIGGDHIKDLHISWVFKHSFAIECQFMWMGTSLGISEMYNPTGSTRSVPSKLSIETSNNAVVYYDVWKFGA